MFRELRNYWRSEAGPRDVLALALPLFLSTCSLTIQVFVDRLFLTWYSADAIAASIPAVCVLWLLAGPLNGIVSFANTFVAQYHGAGRDERVGPVIGQAILVSLLGGSSLMLLYPEADVIFHSVGHARAVSEQETIYFQTLLVSAAPMLVMNAVAGFFGGLGRTWVVLGLNLVTTCINLVLDYVMIFGHFGFPEMGIVGAGLATSIAYLATALLSLGLLWAADSEGQFGIRRRNLCPRPVRMPLSVEADGHSSTDQFHRFLFWPDLDLLIRMLRFGAPNGLMILVDVFAWTWFILLVGRLGTTELAATNVAFNINLFAFGPIIGVGTAVQILVGQRLGGNRPDLAARSTWSAFWLSLVYTLVLGAGYFFTPDFFIAPLRWNASPEEFASWHDVVVVLLRYVVVYAIFDMAAFVFASALRGAGDTRFVMTATLCLALGVMIVPSYLVVGRLSSNLLVAWCFVAGYVLALGSTFFLRFQAGRWRSMRVIEGGAEGGCPLSESRREMAGVGSPPTQGNQDLAIGNRQEASGREKVVVENWL